MAKDLLPLCAVDTDGIDLLLCVRDVGSHEEARVVNVADTASLEYSL